MIVNLWCFGCCFFVMPCHYMLEQDNGFVFQFYLGFIYEWTIYLLYKNTPIKLCRMTYN